MKKLLGLFVLLGITGCDDKVPDITPWAGMANQPLMQATNNTLGESAHVQFILNQQNRVSFRILFPSVCEQSADPVNVPPLVINSQYVKMYGMCSGTDYIQFPQTFAGSDYVREQFRLGDVTIGSLVFSNKNFVNLYQHLEDYHNKVETAI